MKKLLALIIVCTLTFSITACSKSSKEDQEPEQPEISEETEIDEDDEEEKTELPNPIVEYETVDEAAKNLDFEPIIPNIPKDYVISSVCVIDGELFQATFKNEEEELCYRMAEGDEDISGDYNEYEETQEVEVFGKEATLKGNGDEIYLMNWCDDEFTYSISFIQGVSQETAEEILNN